MSAKLLTQMVRFAISETRVDRAYAFDSEGMLVEHAVLDSRSTAAPDISDYMHSLVRRALSTGQLVLSNNTFIDPSEAPSTNTSIKNLRIFVVIPIRGIGACSSISRLAPASCRARRLTVWSPCVSVLPTARIRKA